MMMKEKRRLKRKRKKKNMDKTMKKLQMSSLIYHSVEKAENCCISTAKTVFLRVSLEFPAELRLFRDGTISVSSSK